MSSSSFQLVSEIVRAGAGAGKTTTLTKQVLQVAFEFYHRHQSFPRMVVTTFSRKATQELSERLVVEGIKTDRPDFLDYVSSRASIQISTIHGVLSLFLRRYGHLLDLDSGFRLLSESDAHLMAKGLLREILIDSPRHLDLLETWAVKDLIEMLRFYHCAVLANRDIQVASLETNFSLMGLYFGPEVSQLLKDIKQARSETEVESWKEYFTRLEEILVQIGKLSQSKGWTELDQMISRLGRKPSFSTKKVPEAFSPELRHRIEQLWKKIGDKLKKRGVRFESWETIRIQSLAFQDLAESFHSLFLEKKEKLGLIEMGDLELMTLEKLRQHPEVGEAFARDWDYWLIDEFQDTSPVQVELLKLLMGDRQSFLVGDPQQSIYLFRGARSEVFEEKWQDVKRQGGKQMEKRTNYRSNPPLLHFINQVFAQIGDQFSPMEPKKSEGECSREVAVFAEAKYFVHQEEEVQTEMAAIVHHIQRLVDRGVSFENICILGRTNRHLEEVARYLRKQAYPVHVHAASGFYRRREVVDGLSLVRFLLNPRDNVNLIALLRSPFFRVSDQELAEWLGSKPLSLWDYLQREKVVHSSLVQLSNYLEEVDRIGLSETLRKMVLNEGIMDFSLHYDATGRREANIWKFLLHLERTARKPAARFLNMDSGQEKEEETDGGSGEKDAVTALEPNRINLMTVHSSKGLQFSHVILPHCDSYSSGGSSTAFGVHSETNSWGVSFRDESADETLMSLSQLVSSDEKKKRESLEHERLLYVALTRAKESLMVTWSGTPRVGSWAEMLRGWAKEPGTHRFDHFDISVEKGPWPILSYRARAKKGPHLRPLLNIPKQTMREHMTEQENLGPKFSVSQYLEEKLSLPQMQVLQTGAEGLQGRVKASARGILVHRIMEVLHYCWDFDFDPVLESWFGAHSEKVRLSLSYIRNCAHPAFSQLIPGGQVEWGFQVPTSKGILEGQIDLWGKDGDGQYWLVDYKSGSDKYLNKAVHQLSLYSFGLRSLGINEPIQLAVVYPLDLKCHVQPAPHQQELEQMFPELF